MNGLMNRRRALMAQLQGRDASILWTQENLAVNGGSIDSGKQLFLSDLDWSIALDLTVTSFSNAQASFLLWAQRGANYAVYFIRNGNLPYVNYMGGTQKINNTAMSAGRYRLIANHAAESGEADFYYKKDQNPVETVTITRGFAASDSTVKLGSGSGNNQLPQGIVNSATIRSRILSADEITAFFAD